MVIAEISLKLADQCWIALALLHAEKPERTSFTPSEVRERAEREWGILRPGFTAHIYQHLVANVPPSTGKYQMFFRENGNRLRLFRSGDASHPAREGKMHPGKDASLGQYEWLINWYKEEYLRAAAGHEKGDPVLGMRGVGKKIWQSMDADEYVADLRRGWE